MDAKRQRTAGAPTGLRAHSSKVADGGGFASARLPLADSFDAARIKDYSMIIREGWKLRDFVARGEGAMAIGNK